MDDVCPLVKVFPSSRAYTYKCSLKQVVQNLYHDANGCDTFHTIQIVGYQLYGCKRKDDQGNLKIILQD